MRLCGDYQKIKDQIYEKSIEKSNSKVLVYVEENPSNLYWFWVKGVIMAILPILQLGDEILRKKSKAHKSKSQKIDKNIP